jgi:hypothetical protein
MEQTYNSNMSGAPTFSFSGHDLARANADYSKWMNAFSPKVGKPNNKRKNKNERRRRKANRKRK